MTKITAIKNASYKVDGPITLEDASGQVKAIAEGKSVWLCRCGGSKNKPFCDGSHKVVGFKSDK